MKIKLTKERKHDGSDVYYILVDTKNNGWWHCEEVAYTEESSLVLYEQVKLNYQTPTIETIKEETI